MRRSDPRAPAPRFPGSPGLPRLVIATTNPGKIREIAEVLAGVPFTLTTIGDWPGVDPPDETGHTFAENARLKARYYAAVTGELTVAEDSGLEIAALGGAPGVASARYGGADATYPEKFRLIYDALRDRGLTTSPARFVCALALVHGDTVQFEASGTVEGSIAPVPRGEGGFGYDPVFYYPPLGVTLADAGARKLAVSHRGKAFRALRDYLAPDRPIC